MTLRAGPDELSDAARTSSLSFHVCSSLSSPWLGFAILSRVSCPNWPSLQNLASIDLQLQLELGTA